MKIVKVECEFLLVGVNIPVRDTQTEFGMLLVTVETDSGIRGIGVNREREFQASGVREVIVNDIAPLLTGDRKIGPSHVWNEVQFGVPAKLRSEYRASSGILNAALSTIDQALWDAWGQTVGEPVYQLLGGAQPEVEIYATFGLNFYNPDEEMEAARRLQKKGFTAFKLQGSEAESRREITHDAARVKRLRETVGDEARIILDGRTNYSLYRSIGLAKLIEPYNVAFYDEPVFAHDPVAMQQLRRACPGLCLAARSRGGSAWDNRDLIASGAVDVLGTNVVDQGGFTQGIKIAHMAEMYQLPLVTGGAFHLQNSHLIAAVGNGWMTEYHALVAAVGEALFVDPLMPIDGKIHLGDKPGLGLTLDAAAVQDSRERAARVRRAAHAD
jgi:L-alanine-DL-glutamate epimerase-like enolase superfamily enzyme